MTDAQAEKVAADCRYWAEVCSGEDRSFDDLGFDNVARVLQSSADTISNLRAQLAQARAEVEPKRVLYAEAPWEDWSTPDLGDAFQRWTDDMEAGEPEEVGEIGQPRELTVIHEMQSEWAILTANGWERHRSEAEARAAFEAAPYNPEDRAAEEGGK